MSIPFTQKRNRHREICVFDDFGISGKFLSFGEIVPLLNVPIVNFAPIDFVNRNQISGTPVMPHPLTMFWCLAWTTKLRIRLCRQCAIIQEGYKMSPQIPGRIEDLVYCSRWLQ